MQKFSEAAQRSFQEEDGLLVGESLRVAIQPPWHIVCRDGSFHESDPFFHRDVLVLNLDDSDHIS